MRNSFIFFLLICFCFTSEAQIKLTELPVDTVATSDDVSLSYGDISGTPTLRTLPFTSQKRYFSPNIVAAAINYIPTTVGAYSDRGKIVKDTNNDVWYIDGDRNAVLIRDSVYISNDSLFWNGYNIKLPAADSSLFVTTSALLDTLQVFRDSLTTGSVSSSFTSVDSLNAIPVLTSVVEDIIYVRSKGSFYYVQSDSVPGFVTDSKAVVLLASGNYAILQPTSLGYDVQHVGIFGDGATDQTNNLDSLFAFVETQTASNSIYWPADTGRYVIERLRFKSNMTVNFEPETEIVGDGTSTGLFYLANISNVRLNGNGAKMFQSRTGGTANMNYILGCSDVIISNFRLEGTGKDGIYIGLGDTINTNILIEDMVIDSMKRQGISIVSCDGCTIRGGSIKNTQGSSPAAGIDVEGNDTDVTRNILIDNVFFSDHPDQGAVALFKGNDITIQNCVFTNNMFGINIDRSGAGQVSLDIESVDNTTEEFVTATPHGLSVGDILRVKTDGGGTLPTGIVSTTSTFFVFSVVNDTTVTLSANYKGNAVNLTTDGVLPLQLEVWDLGNLSNITIQSNHFYNNTSHNIYGEQAQFIKVLDNDISGGYGGINLINVPNTTIKNNTLKDNVGGRAIYVTHKSAIISGNNIFRSKEEAIEISGSEHSIITNNYTEDCGVTSNFAMYFKYFKRSIISGNTVSNPNLDLDIDYGIISDAAFCEFNIISNNSVKNDYINTTRSITSSATDYRFLNVLNDDALEIGDVSRWATGTQSNPEDITFATGDVMIGDGATTLNSIYPLDIVDAAPSLRLYDTTLGSSHILSANNTQLRVSSASEMSLRPGTDLTLYLGGSDKHQFESGGNVGIGTITPTAVLDINSDILRLRTAKTPASASATGNAGDIAWDATYFYICVATNTWQRVAHATW